MRNHLYVTAVTVSKKLGFSVGQTTRLVENCFKQHHSR